MALINKYNSFLKNQFNGAAVIDFESDTIKVAVVTSAYTPSATAHVWFSDITNEVSGTNYPAGGVALSSKTITESAGTVTFDAADVTISQSSSGFSNGRYVILYKDTGTASTSPLIGYINIGLDKGNVVADLVIQFAPAGIFTVV